MRWSLITRRVGVLINEMLDESWEKRKKRRRETGRPVDEYSSTILCQHIAQFSCLNFGTGEVSCRQQLDFDANLHWKFVDDFSGFWTI